MTFTPQSEGGEYKHTLTTNEMPSHKHPSTRPNLIQNSAVGSAKYGYISNGSWADTGSIGSDQSHNNIQPYITVYYWKRIS